MYTFEVAVPRQVVARQATFTVQTEKLLILLLDL